MVVYGQNESPILLHCNKTCCCQTMMIYIFIDCLTLQMTQQCQTHSLFLNEFHKSSIPIIKNLYFETQPALHILVC